MGSWNRAFRRNLNYYRNLWARKQPVRYLRNNYFRQPLSYLRNNNWRRYTNLPVRRYINRNIIRRENFQKINPAIYNTPNPETIAKNLKIVQTNINNLNTFISSVLSNTINNIQFTHSNLDNSNTSIEFNSAKSFEEYILNTLDKQANLVLIDLNKIRDVVSMGVIKNSYDPIKILFNQNYNTIDNNLKKYLNNPSRQTSSQPAAVTSAPPEPAPAPAPAPPVQIPTYTAPVISTRATPNPNMITQQNYYNFGRTVEGFNDYISPNYINNMPIIEGLNHATISEIGQAEKELIRQLNDFNQKYELYVECNDPTNKNRGNLVCSGNNAPTSASLIAQMNNINGIINDMNDKVGAVNLKKNYSYRDYKRNYYNIVNDHSTVRRLRNELDTKVQRLYNPEQSMISDYGYNLDSTIYSGILISALATSVLYYIFTEL
jgi:hypothetical protein